VVMYRDDDLRLSVYLIPAWLGVLFIGYRFRGAPVAVAA